MPTVTALRCNSMRRRRKSTSDTRSAAASPQRSPPTPSSTTRERYRPDPSASRCSRERRRSVDGHGLELDRMSPGPGPSSSPLSELSRGRESAGSPVAAGHHAWLAIGSSEYALTGSGYQHQRQPHRCAGTRSEPIVSGACCLCYRQWTAGPGDGCDGSRSRPPSAPLRGWHRWDGRPGGSQGKRSD